MIIKGKITYKQGNRRKSYSDIYRFENYDPNTDYYRELITQDLLEIVNHKNIVIEAIDIIPMQDVVDEQRKTMNALQYLFS